MELGSFSIVINNQRQYALLNDHIPDHQIEMIVNSSFSGFQFRNLDNNHFYQLIAPSFHYYILVGSNG